MQLHLLAVCFGLGSVAFWPELPPAWMAWFCGALTIVLLRFFSALRYVAISAALMLGCSVGTIAGHHILKTLLDPAMELQDVIVTGRLVKLETVGAATDANFRRFEFSVTESTPIINAKYLRLSWHWRDAEAPILREGQIWQLPVRLRRPRGFSNPHGFDYGRWLIRRGFDATGYIRFPDTAILLRDSDRASFRQAHLSKLLQQLDGLVNRGVLLALAMGERGDVADELWQHYVTTGTAHLMAISGLHIGIAAMLGFMFGGALVRVCGRGASWLPVAVALIAAVYYAALAGFSLPTQRAVAMTAVGLLTIVLKRQVSLDSAWVLALLVVLIIDPLAPHSAGFWLSFCAVGALLLVMASSRQLHFSGLSGRAWNSLRAMLQAQWAVFIGLLPVLAIGLGQISIASLPANLLFIPLFSLLIVPLVLLALIAGSFSENVAAPFWQFADNLLSIAHSVMNWLAMQPWAAHKSDVALMSLPGLLAIVGAIILLLPRALPGRWLGAVLLLPLLLYQMPKADESKLVLTVLDVGQGLSAVVSVADKTLVYDLGPELSQRFNTADAVVRPYLLGEGIEQVDRLIISHADQDHAGAAAQFIDSMPVVDILWGEPVLGVAGSACEAGQKWRWSKAEFSVIYPPANIAGSGEREGNNSSCVVMISYEGTRILLTGDVEASAEAELIQRVRDLDVDILTAPHHGSGTSSTADFVAATSPAHVIYAAGYKHHFGHPKASVVGRYREAGAIAWSTAEQGTIQVVISANDVTVKSNRQRRVYFDPRYNPPDK